jgi:hypothetical protein
MIAAAAWTAFVVTGASAQHGIGIHARGFADFNYIESERGISQGFRTGQVVGHVVASLTDRIALFSEVSATPSSNGFSVEAERLLLRYDHNDAVRVGIGRFHAPISYWNQAFHHGQWLQPSLSRPELARPTSGFIPMHFVGVWAEGSVRPGVVELQYTLGLGNGRHTNLRRAGDSGDANDSRSVVASGAVVLPAPLGLQLGGAYYHDRVTPAETLDANERIVTAHFARNLETPEFIIEFARITHDPRSYAGPITHSESAYVLLGYRLPGRLHALKPYVRVDRTRVPVADSVFAPLGLNYSGRTAGVRLDLAAPMALKFEYRSERIEFGPPLGTFAAQLSFTFPGARQDASVITDHDDTGHDGAGTAASQSRQR